MTPAIYEYRRVISTITIHSPAHTRYKNSVYTKVNRRHTIPRPGL